MLIAGLSMRGFRSLAKSDLRTSRRRNLSGAMRYLFDRASTTGKFHRLVIDVDEGRYWAEVSDDRFYMPREPETEEELREREAEGGGEDEAGRRRKSGAPRRGGRRAGDLQLRSVEAGAAATSAQAGALRRVQGAALKPVS